MIRRLAPGDELLVRAIAENFKSHVPSEPAARAFLADERNLAVAALDGENVAGFAYGYALDRIDGRRMVFFYELEVAHGRRGEGLGRDLAHAMVAEARRAGAYKMWVQTDAENEPAVRTYTGAGARQVAVDLVFGWDL